MVERKEVRVREGERLRTVESIRGEERKGRKRTRGYTMVKREWRRMREMQRVRE